MANALKWQWSPEEAVEKLYKHGLFDSQNRGFLQTLIDNTIEIDENAFFWQEHFRVEGNEYDIDILWRHHAGAVVPVDGEAM